MLLAELLLELHTPFVGIISGSIEMPFSDYLRVIQGLSLMHCRWACQRPIGLAQNAIVCGHLHHPDLCNTKCVIRTYRGMVPAYPCFR